jgi:hypothetical protein
MRVSLATSWKAEAQRQWHRVHLDDYPGAWREELWIESQYIAPGKPMQNGFVEAA